MSSCAEYTGAVGVPGASKITNSARAESLGIYGGSFARSAETSGICNDSHSIHVETVGSRKASMCEPC